MERIAITAVAAAAATKEIKTPLHKNQKDFNY